MDLNSFKNWAVSQGSVAKYNDGQYKGECVSLINQYCYRVLNVPAGVWGHAKAWGYDSNTNVRTYFNKVNDVQAGDILVYDTGEYGHIEIALGGGQSLAQNRNYDRKVKVQPTLVGYSAILRSKSKGEDMTITDRAMLEKEWAGFLDRPPMDSEYKEYVGKPLESVLDTVWKSPEFKNRMDGLRKAFHENLDLKAENVKLRKQVADGAGEFVKVSDLYIKN